MSKKKPELKLHGNLPGQSHMPTVLGRIRKFLDELPVHEAFTSEGLAGELKVSLNYIQTYLKYLGEEYRYKEGAAFGYGNPETVKLKKEGFYERKEKP